MIDDSPPRDHVVPEPDDHDARARIEENIRSGATWLRLFFMLVMVLLYSIARIVTAASVVIQFFIVLFTGEVNQPLKRLGEQLARYIYQIILYLTFNSDERPFPFDLEWPVTPDADRPENTSP